MCWLSDCAALNLAGQQLLSEPGVHLSEGKIGITFTFRAATLSADEMPVLKHVNDLLKRLNRWVMRRYFIAASDNPKKVR